MLKRQHATSLAVPFWSPQGTLRSEPWGEAGDGLPWESQGVNEGKTLAWTTKAGEAVWQQGCFGTTLDQGAEDTHGPFPIPSNVGLGARAFPGAVQAISAAHLSSRQHRFPKFTWGPVYFSSFFKSTIVLRSVFLLAKVTVGPALCGVSCLPSAL